MAAPYHPTAQGYAYRPPKPAASSWGSIAQTANVGGLKQLAGQIPAGVQGVGGGPGMNTDWSGLIGGDWEVQGAQAEADARMGRARGDFQSQLRQMLIDLGVTDKSKLGNLGQYIDANTIAQAAANKYSKTAQIAQQETQANAQNQAALAARGILTSGQMTTDLENVTAQAESARYQGLRDFLSGGAQGLSSLADLQDQLDQGIAQARANAAQRAAEQYYWNQQMMGGGYGPTPAPAPAAGMAGGALSALARTQRPAQSAYQKWLQEHGV